jgi:hypothetical protein
MKYVALTLGVYSFVVGAWFHSVSSLLLGGGLGSLLIGLGVMLFVVER